MNRPDPYYPFIDKSPLGRRGHQQGVAGCKNRTNPSPAREIPEYRVEVNREIERQTLGAGLVLSGNKCGKQVRNLTPTEGGTGNFRCSTDICLGVKRLRVVFRIRGTRKCGKDNQEMA